MDAWSEAKILVNFLQAFKNAVRDAHRFIYFPKSLGVLIAGGYPTNFCDEILELEMNMPGTANTLCLMVYLTILDELVLEGVD